MLFKPDMQFKFRKSRRTPIVLRRDLSKPENKQTPQLSVLQCARKFCGQQVRICDSLASTDTHLVRSPGKRHKSNGASKMAATAVSHMERTTKVHRLLVESSRRCEAAPGTTCVLQDPMSGSPYWSSASSRVFGGGLHLSSVVCCRSARRSAIASLCSLCDVCFQ